MNKEKQNIIPELRFPEFIGSWSVKVLSKCAEVIDPHPSHRAPSSVVEGIPFIGIGDISENGMLDKKNVRIVSKEIYEEHSARYKLRIGDFAYGRVASVGKVVNLSNNIDKTYTYSPTMAIIQPKSIDSKFLRFFCHSSFFIKQVNSKTSGSTRKSIGMQNLRVLKILVPKDPKEQQKIANCLSSLNDVITAETEKLELLQDHKRGLLQQLFPAEGETQPNYRFPEFENDGSWEEKELKKLIVNISPPKKLKSNQFKESGKHPIIDQSQNEIAGWTDDEAALIKNDFPLIVFGDHTCILKIRENPFVQGADGIKIFKGNSLIATRYLYYALESNPLIMKEYKRHYSILKGKVISYPDINSGEQQKIAKCLSSVDELIESQTQKVKALKKHKKGLMQQLFPNVNSI
jgi:type I restriction enzyme, S subunit